MKKLYTKAEVKDIIKKLFDDSNALNFSTEDTTELIYSLIHCEDNIDGRTVDLGKGFEPWFNENVPDEAEEGQVSVGVGDGSGKLIVYGDYEAVKTVQDKLLAMESMYFKEEVKDKFDQFFDYCSEQDAEYNWWYESRLEEWFDKNVK